jgi:hypothetical protein
VSWMMMNHGGIQLQVERKDILLEIRGDKYINGETCSLAPWLPAGLHAGKLPSIL